MSSDNPGNKPNGAADFVANLLRIRRVEFRIGEIPILLMPPMLERALGAPPATLGVWVEASIAFFFLFAYGDMINCLADRDLDAKYKKHLSDAVYALGPRFVAIQVAGSALAAMGIAVHLAWQWHRWLLIPTVLMGLILGAAYSVEPVRLKGRGLWHLVCLWLIIFFGPMLFLSLLLRPFPSIALLVFAASYATMQMGVILINSAEDYPEDREAGVRNTVVTYGIYTSVRLAAAMVSIGGLIVLGTMAVLYNLRHAPVLCWIGLALFECAVLFVGTDMARLLQTVMGASEEVQIAAVKQAAKRVPIWITVIAWTTCLAVWILYHQVIGRWFG